MENNSDHKFERLRQRVDELQRRATPGPAQQQMPQDVFEELLTAMEELQVAQEQLLQQNEELVATRHAVEALAVVGQNSVTAILMDVMMPRMDGFEVCRRVKADPATAHIPVVLVTGLIGHMHYRQGMEAGADEFVNKPVNMADLLSVLDRVLPDGWHD